MSEFWWQMSSGYCFHLPIIGVNSHSTNLFRQIIKGSIGYLGLNWTVKREVPVQTFDYAIIFAVKRRHLNNEHVTIFYRITKLCWAQIVDFLSCVFIVKMYVLIPCLNKSLLHNLFTSQKNLFKYKVYGIWLCQFNIIGVCITN
jgi:hypothetical protein